MTSMKIGFVDARSILKVNKLFFLQEHTKETTNGRHAQLRSLISVFVLSQMIKNPRILLKEATFFFTFYEEFKK